MRDFIAALKREPLVKKYLSKTPWLSGGSTWVFPITVSKRTVELQWESDKAIFRKFIERVVREHGDVVEAGYFRRGDGSCPSTIVFVLTQKQDKGEQYEKTNG